MEYHDRDWARWAEKTAPRPSVRLDVEKTEEPVKPQRRKRKWYIRDAIKR